MTEAIRIIHPEALDGIITYGKPLGFWLALTDPKRMRWCGCVADGKNTVRNVGDFGAVLTWLMVKAGGCAEPKQDSPEASPGARNGSRDPEWRIKVSTDPGIRIPGAEIQEWTGQDWAEYYEDRPLVVNAARANAIKTDTLPPLTDQDREIIRLIGQGHTFHEIARAVGRSVTRVYERQRQLRALGYDVPPARRDTVREAMRQRDEEILRIGLEGKSARKAAKELGITVTVAEKTMARLREEGRLPAVPQACQRKIDRSAVKDLWERGYRAGEIADRLGIALRSARRIIAEIREDMG